MTLADAVYTTNLSRKGALLDETLTVLSYVEAGESVEAVRRRVLADDLLLKTTLATRQGIWEEIRSRYMSDGELLPPLARMVVQAPDRITQRLVLFYEYCLSEPLLRDTVLGCIYPRYAAGFSGIGKAEIQQFFDEKLPAHPEIATWSPQTRDKVVSNILSILRDFGLLAGTQRKQFARLYVPLPAFVYVLHRRRSQGRITAPAVLNDEVWHLFFLERGDLTPLLEEASAQGHCIFKHQADVMDLEWVYPSLEACVAAITRQV